MNLETAIQNLADAINRQTDCYNAATGGDATAVEPAPVAEPAKRGRPAKAPADANLTERMADVGNNAREQNKTTTVDAGTGKAAAVGEATDRSEIKKKLVKLTQMADNPLRKILDGFGVAKQSEIPDDKLGELEAQVDAVIAAAAAAGSDGLD